MENINLPLASDYNKIAIDAAIGTLLISFDNKHVYAKDWSNGKEDGYVLLLNDISFIESNPHFFEKL